VKPILQISEQVQDVKNLKLDSISRVYTHISEINTLSKSMVQMGTGLKAFNKYLPTDLVRKLISRGIEAKLGGEEKVVTAFFSDLVSFTKISEQYGNALIPFLGDCLGDMSREIDNQNGTIDKYIGDAIMAFWGAPIPNDKHATDACRAALHCQRILAATRNNTKDLNRPEFKARIGINTGTVIVGNMGYEDRMDYTILGDPVKVASRLEAINKQYGTEILIGEDTFLEAKDDIIVRNIDIVAPYGKSRGLDVYELLAMKDEVSIGDDFSWILIFETGLNLYKENQWEQALSRFEKVQQVRHQEDGPSKHYINKCKEYMVCPPKAKDELDNGITVMTSKK
jgi:adenylate cyclase